MASISTQQHPSLQQIEIELKARVAGYPPTLWGRKQTDDWDTKTRFIYRVWQWETLQQRIALFEQPLANYAINRWFNFWSAYAVEQIFCTLPGVKANLNHTDRLVDFSINGINFDHKTTVFPHNYAESPRFAWQNKAHLIDWLYRHQSRGQRYHTANRLFIVLYAKNGEHWALRAEIGLLRRIIKTYVVAFSPARLVKIDIEEQSALSDLIWCVK